MTFGIAIEADGNEILNKKSCISETFKIFFRGSGNLSSSSTAINKYSKGQRTEYDDFWVLVGNKRDISSRFLPEDCELSFVVGSPFPKYINDNIVYRERKSYNGDEINCKSFIAEFLFKIDEGQLLVVANVFKKEDLEIIEIFFLICQNKSRPSFIRSHRRFGFGFYPQYRVR